MARSGVSSAVFVLVVLLAGLGVWLLQAGRSGAAPEDRSAKDTTEAPPVASETAFKPPESPAFGPNGKAAGAADPDKPPREQKPVESAAIPKGEDTGTDAHITPPEAAASVDEQPVDPAAGGFRPTLPEGDVRPDPLPSSVDGLKAVVLESGVKYWDIKVGEGLLPHEDAMIITSFRAWLMDGDNLGELVDSSTHQGYNPPFYKKSLVPGLQEGLWSMHEGGIRQVYLPADQGWGAKGKPPAIPPNSDMLFQVQLMEVRNPPVQTSVAGMEPQTTKSGVKYWDLEVGNGPAVLPRADVKIRYTAWLEDGTMFDTTEMIRQPRSFSLARGVVIAGWREGIPGMRVGGKRRLEVPPGLGYGEAGAGPIPPHATLTFEVEVIKTSGPWPLPTPSPLNDIKSVTTETGLTYWDIKEGSGSIPEAESTVTAHYSIWLSDGTLCQTTKEAGRPVAMPLHRLNRGMNEGISSMKVGGIRQMRVPPDLAYGELGALPEIPPNATLTIEVELLGVE